MSELTQRQNALFKAVVAASGDKQTRLKLILPYASRYAASQRDITVVEQLIVGGRVRECAG